MHSGVPSFSISKPVYVNDLPERERENRVKLNSDLCEILPSDGTDDDAITCIRTVLEIPIKGMDEPFTWGVWVTQSRGSFQRYVQTFNEDQSDQSSFGWLPVTMPYYHTENPDGSLLHLECDVNWRGKGARPKLTLWEADHEFSVDQKQGISIEKATKIANVIGQCSSR